MIKDETISKTLFTSGACKEFFWHLKSLVSFTKTKNNWPEKKKNQSFVYCIILKSMLVQHVIDFVEIFSRE